MPPSFVLLNYLTGYEMKKTVYIVTYDIDLENSGSWTLVGIFGLESDAITACTGPRYGYTPVTTNQTLNESANKNHELFEDFIYPHSEKDTVE